MGHIDITESGIVNAPAQVVYDLLADYKNGHPRLLPQPYFSNLVVEKGGKGAGTVIRFKTQMGGQTREGRSIISEPEPGRVLVESDTDAAYSTSFIVTPSGQNQCKLEIATQFRVGSGLRGFIEKLMIPRMLKPIYKKQLVIINEVASKEAVGK